MSRHRGGGEARAARIARQRQAGAAKTQRRRDAEERATRMHDWSVALERHERPGGVPVFRPYERPYRHWHGPANPAYAAAHPPVLCDIHAGLEPPAGYVLHDGPECPTNAYDCDECWSNTCCPDHGGDAQQAMAADARAQWERVYA